MQEVTHLRKAGHRVRILAKGTELGAVHLDIYKAGLLEDLVFSDNRRRFRKRVTQFLLFLWKIGFKHTYRRNFSINFYATRPLRLGLQDALGLKNLRCGTKCWVDSARAALCIFSVARRVHNLSIAINHTISLRSSFKPDVIHCPFTFEWEVKTLAKLIAQYPGVPYTITLRSRDLHGPWHLDSFGPLKSKPIRRCDQILTISQFNRTHLQTLFPHQQNIPVVHSSIDPHFFARSQPAVSSVRFEIVSVARLVEKKGLDVLIQACAILKAKRIAFRCRLYGQGLLKRELQLAIRNNGLAKDFVLEPPASREEIKAALNSSNVFVLPCVVAKNGDRDILPNSLKEAMAMQVPVVTSRISGIEELIKHGVNGILVSPNSAEALAEQLLLLKVDHEMRCRLGRAGRISVLREYNIYRESRKFLRILSEVVDKMNIQQPGTSTLLEVN